jgi:hypothetical protein
MTDLEHAQAALPNPDSGVEIVGLGNFNANAIWTTYSGGLMLKMFLAGMAKAREIDAQICGRWARQGWLVDGAAKCVKDIESQGIIS